MDENLSNDVYRLSKEQLQAILARFNIKYNDEDRVADLRPIVADLKAYLKNNFTEEKKLVLNKLLSRKSVLTPGELQKYPGLSRIEQFISERDNLYDVAEIDESGENNYEDVVFPEVDSVGLEDERNGGQASHSRETNVDPERTDGLASRKGSATGNDLAENRVLRSMTESKPTMPRENIPLISAGTYHGLQTENPMDFLDKYEIAACSNNWSDDTKINLFPAHLASTALTWYKHYSVNGVGDDWEELKKHFLATFTPAAQAQTLQALLERKVQGRNQPVISYYLEILSICKRHDPDTPEKQIIQYIIQGLRPEFCDKILNETCDTLQQLEKSLKKIELQMEIRNLNREKYNRAENVGVTTNYSDIHRQEINNLQAEIKNLTQMVANLSVQKSTPSNTGHHDPKQNTHSNNRQHMEGETHLKRNTTYRPTHQHPRMEWRPQHAYATRPGYQNRTWNPHSYTHTPRPQGSYNRKYTDYCSVCNKNNHNTRDCWFKRQAKYCDHCKMTNHNKEECFRLNKSRSNQKNE